MIKFLNIILLLILMITANSCFNQDVENRRIIQKYIPLNLDDFKVLNSHYAKIHLSDDNSAFNIYIALKIDSVNANRIMDSLHLIKYDSIKINQFNEMYCINYYKPQLFWKIQSLNFEVPFEQKMRKHFWWMPKYDDISNCYFSNYIFFNNYDNGKPILCSKKKRDGRIVAQYYNMNLYILIECFLK